METAVRSQAERERVKDPSHDRNIASWNKAQKRQAFVQVTKAHTAFQKREVCFPPTALCGASAATTPRADCVSVTS